MADAVELDDFGMWQSAEHAFEQVGCQEVELGPPQDQNRAG